MSIGAEESFIAEEGPAEGAARAVAEAAAGGGTGRPAAPWKLVDE